MKVAIVSESPADEAVIAILVDSLTGRKNQLVSSGRIRPGGWTGVISSITVEMKSLHYGSDAHALIAIVDSDDSPIHDGTHEISEQPTVSCRICQILKHVRRARSVLRPRPVPYPLDVVVGQAVPALEAWLLYGSDPHIIEAKFERDQVAGDSLKMARAKLKRQLYGVENPSVARKKEIGERAARVISTKLSNLEMAFPKGFGRFAQQIRCCQI